MLPNSRQDLKNTKGSPAFMSPEMLEKKSYQGRPLDIWAAGITLYFFIFRHLPFTGKNYLDLAKSIQNNDILFDFQVDNELEDLLRKLLTKDPKKRIIISEIKQHPWITQNGTFPMTEEYEKFHVSENEIRSAIRHINNLAGFVVKTKGLAKKYSHSRSTKIPKLEAKNKETIPRRLPKIIIHPL
jgi:[calcium/calmodulin-dependent protein kinase] kinase